MVAVLQKLHDGVRANVARATRHQHLARRARLLHSRQRHCLFGNVDTLKESCASVPRHIPPARRHDGGGWPPALPPAALPGGHRRRGSKSGTQLLAAAPFGGTPAGRPLPSPRPRPAPSQKPRAARRGRKHGHIWRHPHTCGDGTRIEAETDGRAAKRVRTGGGSTPRRAVRGDTPLPGASTQGHRRGRRAKRLRPRLARGRPERCVRCAVTAGGRPPRRKSASARAPRRISNHVRWRGSARDEQRRRQGDGRGRGGHGGGAAPHHVASVARSVSPPGIFSY